MTEILTDRADVALESRDERVARVGTAPSNSTPIETILEDELVEDVSIDGMCGVY